MISALSLPRVVIVFLFLVPKPHRCIRIAESTVLHCRARAAALSRDYAGGLEGRVVSSGHFVHTYIPYYLI